ncbi:hypothetical protein FJZ21_00100 [Candidatus Pacearchaeota archaeon]|nr:hypothetical protein [Candidatus Pacearchaeota archaeon]
MHKLVVNYHPSAAVVQSAETDEFLFSRYDLTYPVLPYRLSANVIGGNPTPKDTTPWQTWQREVCEEFHNEAPHGETLRDTTTPFAPLEEIHRIRDAILAGARPYADFHVSNGGISLAEYLGGVGKGLKEAEFVASLPEKKRMELKNTGLVTRAQAELISIFHSVIPQEEIERVKHYLAKGMRLVTEGGSRVLTRNQLVNGIEGEVERNKSYLTAHTTPFVMSNFLGLSHPIMHPERSSAVRLVTPVRASYADYESDPMFDYKPIRK